MNSLQTKASIVASPLLIMFAFALPLSTSAGSVLAILILLSWIIAGDKSIHFREIFSNPVAIAVLAYILLHIIALLWTEDMTWGLEILKKQWKLLLFPIFLTISKKKHSKFYMAAFVSAIFLKACKAYLVWLGFITLDPASIFTTTGTSHVIYNPMLALACYVVLQNLVFGKNSSVLIWAQSALFLFLSCNMFITVGRTGQIAYFVLLAIILFQYFFNKSKKLLLVTLLCIPLLIVGTYQFSSTFKDRVDTAMDEVEHFTTGGITSVGSRVWFLKNTIQVVKGNWLFGTGTGDFPSAYKEINKVNSPNMPNTDNPHNQYLLVLAQFGIIGLLSLAAIFYSQIRFAFKIKDALTPLRQAFPLFFLVIMFAETYLQVYGTGFLFSLFSSFLYKNET